MTSYIGLMSGTSMDGIDAALVDVETNKLLHGIIYPFSENVKKKLHAVLLNDKHKLQDICQLNTLLGVEFAAASNKLLTECNYPKSAVIAIGSHGQTIIHNTAADIPYTLQLGCAHTIAELTGIPVVADFRNRDLVLGGQGAPLAPIYHQALFADLPMPLAIVNIGGIANLTFLANHNEAIGYDIGPGNCLMDAWISLCGNKSYDYNGEWASHGVVIAELLEKLSQDPFFHKAAPKSIGKEYFSLDWLKNYAGSQYHAVDIQATLLQLTAEIIAESVKQLNPSVANLLLCGGGVHNIVLLKNIINLLPNVNVNSTQYFGIDPNFIEAQMMAWLAYKMINNMPLDLSKITGSSKKSILGVLYPAAVPA